MLGNREIPECVCNNAAVCGSCSECETELDLTYRPRLPFSLYLVKLLRSSAQALEAGAYIIIDLALSLKQMQPPKIKQPRMSTDRLVLPNGAKLKYSVALLGKDQKQLQTIMKYGMQVYICVVSATTIAEYLFGMKRTSPRGEVDAGYAKLCEMWVQM